MERENRRQNSDTSRSKQVMLALGRLMSKNPSGTLDCINSDKKAALHSLFLLNSIIIATFGLYLELEWRKETLNVENSCCWKLELLELFIYGVSFYFFLLTIVSSCSAILSIGRVPFFYKCAFELLIFYCALTFLVLSVSLSSYLVSSRLYSEWCEETAWFMEHKYSLIQRFEFRMTILTVFGILTSVVYGSSAVAQRKKERQMNPEHGFKVRNKNIFLVSCEQPAIPPPPYSQCLNSQRRSYSQLRPDVCRDIQQMS